MVYSVSYKERKRVFWLFERGIGYRRYCKEDNQEASFKGNFRTRCFSDGERGPYNPVGRNKLPKKSKREQKNTRATYYYQSDSIKRKLFIRKKTATSSVTKASAKRTRTKGKSQDGLNDLVSQCAKPS